MDRFSVDTNILIYAFDPFEPEKQTRCQALLDRLTETDTVLTVQVLGEFLNTARRRRVAAAKAQRAVSEWQTLFPLLVTRPDALLRANERAERYQLQFWDSLIVEVCRENGVTTLFSEDFQSGITFDGLSVVNPLERGSAQMIALGLDKPPQ